MSDGSGKSPWSSINDMLIQNKCWLCETPFPRGKPKKAFQVSQVLEFFKARMDHEAASLLEGQGASAVIISQNQFGGDNSGGENISSATDTSISPSPSPSPSLSEVNHANSVRGRSTAEEESKDNAAELSNGSQSVLPGLVRDLLSKNLGACYTSFVDLMTRGEGKDTLLLDVFKDESVEPWMSGLVCGITPECKEELVYFIAPKVPQNPTTGTAAGTAGTAKGMRPFGTGNGAKSNAFSFTKWSAKDCPPGCGCDNPWPFLS